VGVTDFQENGDARREELYAQCVSQYGPALDRLAHAYETDPELHRDLVQDIHLALWRSFERLGSRCSLRIWTYRLAHNVAASHVTRQIKRRSNGPVLLTLEEAEIRAAKDNVEHATDRKKALDRLLALIRRLDLVDRQLILGYLEGLDAETMSEIAGLSPANVWTRVHRIRNMLVASFTQE
jgi:RNA polymerase sigma-70 factor (ECF subfamily)